MKFLMIKFNDSGMERIYDKPLLETENKPELEEHNKTVFKGFFWVFEWYGTDPKSKLC